MRHVNETWHGPGGQQYRIVEDTGDGYRVEITHRDSPLPAEESWSFGYDQFERLIGSLPLHRSTAEVLAAPTRNPYGNNEAERQDLATPRWFFNKVAEAYSRYGQFSLDVCAKSNSAVVPEYYSKRHNGLKQPWAHDQGQLNWCNPPFSQARAWLEKAFDEAHRYDARTVMLLPFRDPASKWFYRYPPFAQRITVLVPRLQYYQCGRDGGFSDNASFCSALWLITRKGVQHGQKNPRYANIDWWKIGKRPEGTRR